MSNIAPATELKVIKEIGKIYKILDGLNRLNKTIEDSRDIQSAESLLDKATRRNGYTPYYIPGKGTTLKKIEE